MLFEIQQHRNPVVKMAQYLRLCHVIKLLNFYFYLKLLIWIDNIMWFHVIISTKTILNTIWMTPNYESIFSMGVSKESWLRLNFYWLMYIHSIPRRILQNMEVGFLELLNYFIFLEYFLAIFWYSNIPLTNFVQLSIARFSLFNAAFFICSSISWFHASII